MVRLINRHPSEMATAVRRTAIRGIQIAKRELPRRSGLLRKSLLAQKNNDFSYLVWHGRNAGNGKLIYADVLEVGTRSSYVIAPRRRKSLLFAIKESALTKGGFVKAGSKKQLFAELKANGKRKKSEKKSMRQIFNEVGVVLLKPGQTVTMPKRSGRFFYRDNIKPKVLNHFKLEIFKAFKRVGYK